MSDRMTNPEIEDVLSSVRRLVSEEVARDRSARLVLTPAFRVAERAPEPDPVPDPEPVAEADPAAEAEAAETGEDLTLEARIAELEAALAVQSAEFEPDYERGDHAEFPPLREVAAVAGTVEEPAEAVAGPEPEDTGDIPEPEETPEPEAAAAADLAPDSEPDPWAAPEPATETEAAGTEAESAAVETLDFVEDTAGEDTGDGDAADDMDPAPAPEPMPETMEAAPEAGLFDDADVLIDEDSLRLLVRDILREELQGPFGERITRNVRKLVRAEIARALAAARVMD